MTRSHGFDPVGDAGRRSGAPAYGFDTTRPDGARLQLYLSLIHI